MNSEPMAPSSSPSKKPKSPNFYLFPRPDITPIQECDGDELEEDDALPEEEPRAPDEINGRKMSTSTNTSSGTPLFEKKKKTKTVNANAADTDTSVSCNKCRPHAKDRNFVVPLDSRMNNYGIPSPNALFKSIVSTLTKRSPKNSAVSSDSKEEQWKLAIAEVSHKLIQTSRQRDEAILEASRLRNSVSELEKKLNKLEIYCYNMKSALDDGESKRRIGEERESTLMGVMSEKVVEQFLVGVSESRSNIRGLSRTLAMQLRGAGGRVFEKLSLLLHPFDVKVNSFSKNPKGSVIYLEALLNRAFFEDFESVGFEKGSTSGILNPIDRCEANYASFNVLKELTWEEVLSKGTKHYSEEFSKFCDRKMSEIVAMLGWGRAWAEPLLQTFFVAAKSVWLVHLLSNSIHPGLPIFRVDKWVGFDPVYMEDVGTGHAASKLVPAMVRIMVTPGFYVYGNVVKCKVLCRYYNHSYQRASAAVDSVSDAGNKCIE